MKIQQAFDLVRDELKKVETQFRENISSDVYLITKIGEYILRSGGKRFRPLMLLLSSRVAGYKGERHIPLAVVVEFIHTATLLHDDVVDNAKIRRGAESANLVWGNGPSILVGDYLLSRAFELAVNDGDQKILKTLSSTTTRMAEGEMLQMLRHSNINTTEEEHLKIVAGKTAVLFSLS
ncbi:MAG TPA: polyprenyl synthetase family protein, partial [Thermodesulfobacteriota bacterium]|nr:polyprenyl synthetase family protein [Thermodesulfobacteriota bacterium]